MLYQSTRGAIRGKDFYDVLLGGLAEDGGLFVPEIWPQLTRDDWRSLRGLSYAALAARVIAPFTQNVLALPELEGFCRKAYARFDHPSVTPLIEIAPEQYAMELFHGPTYAFKDVAMQLLGHLFEDALQKRDQHVTIIGATSGDTGSAAIEAFKGRDRVFIVILHPYGRTSDVQRRQMTSVTEVNVLNIAIDGTFDDCQDLVKAMFADAPFKDEVALSAVNSINWARIAAQIPYYVRAALAVGAPDRDVSFAVPTGNFGNVLAAWVTHRMGLPIRHFCIGSNKNDILTRFILDNDMSVQPVAPSLSPSMDIQVSSNFERLLFEFLGRDSDLCRTTMQGFRQTGRMAVPTEAWHAIGTLFKARRLDDAQTRAEIKRIFDNSHYMADPHSAIGIAAGAGNQKLGIPMIAAATAHPAKFPDAIEAALGFRPDMPPPLQDIMQKPERYDRLACDLGLVQDAIRAHIAADAN
ncbi:MAG: threonine synthase [Acetobacteraceae bacterium]